MQHRQKRAFQIAFTRRQILLTHILLEVSDHHLLNSGVVSRFIFEHYLECTETAMALAVLTVGADTNINVPNFPWFHPIAC